MTTLAIRTAVTAVAALALAAPVATAAQAATSTKTAPVAATAAAPLSLVAENTFRQGQSIALHGDAGNDAHGRAWMRATVVGPHGMKATLSPAADRGYLAGSITVPQALKGSWIRLTLIAPDGHRVSTIVKHA